MLRYMSCCKEKCGILRTTKAGKVYLICINKGCGKRELFNIIRRKNEIQYSKNT